MKSSPRRAFSLVELLVVIAIVAMLMALMLPALNNARELGRQSLCSANLRQQGIAVNTYATDAKGWGPFTNIAQDDANWGTESQYWMVQLASYLAMDSNRSSYNYVYNNAKNPQNMMKVFQCPSTYKKYNWNGYTSYGPNSNITSIRLRTDIGIAKIYWNVVAETPLKLTSPVPERYPNRFILTGESISFSGLVPSTVTPTNPRLYDYLHLRRRGFVFLDGHVDMLAAPTGVIPNEFNLVLGAYKDGNPFYGRNNNIGGGEP